MLSVVIPSTLKKTPFSTIIHWMREQIVQSMACLNDDQLQMKNDIYESGEEALKFVPVSLCVTQSLKHGHTYQAGNNVCGQLFVFWWFMARGKRSRTHVWHAGDRDVGKIMSLVVCLRFQKKYGLKKELFIFGCVNAKSRQSDLYLSCGRCSLR